MRARWLRVSVSGGGCSGFQYGFAFETEQRPDDIAIERDGIVALVDRVSAGYMAGSEIDYVEDLIGASFQVKNPNAVSGCGLRHVLLPRLSPCSKIATWNVNSIKVRLPAVLEWLGSAEPDVVLLQETKSLDEAFPRLEIEDCGYNLLVHGQKTYNGVADPEQTAAGGCFSSGFRGDEEDEQARYVEATTGGVRVASIYLPNGNPVATEEVSLQNRVDGPAHRARRRTTRPRGAGSCSAATTTSFRPISTATTRKPGVTTRSANRNRGRASARCSTPATWKRSGTLHPHRRAYTFLGLSGRPLAKGRGIADRPPAALAGGSGPAGGLRRSTRAHAAGVKASDHTPIWCTLRE